MSATHSMNEGGLVLRLLFQNFIEEREVSTNGTSVHVDERSRLDTDYHTIRHSCDGMQRLVSISWALSTKLLHLAFVVLVLILLPLP